MVTTYLILIGIRIGNHFGPYSRELAPDIDARLHLLCVFSGRILEPNGIALPSKVGYDAIDKGEGGGLVEWHRSKAIIGQLCRDSGRSSRLGCNGARYLGTWARGSVLARMERRDGLGSSGRGDEEQACNALEEACHCCHWMRHAGRSKASAGLA